MRSWFLYTILLLLLCHLYFCERRKNYTFRQSKKNKGQTAIFGTDRLQRAPLRPMLEFDVVYRKRRTLFEYGSKRYIQTI